MARKKSDSKSKKDVNNTPTSNPNLKMGMVFNKSDSVYTKQMIISDKIIIVDGKVFREVVAWNDDRCRRYDTSEDELFKSDKICELDLSYVNEYVLKNKNNEWSEAKIPNL